MTMMMMMIMTMKPSLSCLLLLSLVASFRMSGSCAFVIHPTRGGLSPSTGVRPSTRLFIEDEIADMIDKELYRQQHLKDFENEWMEKNKEAVLLRLNSDDYMMGMGEEDLRENFRQMQKDKKLASKDPYAYCAERCITTGNCDVYEDLYVTMII